MSNLMRFFGRYLTIPLTLLAFSACERNDTSLQVSGSTRAVSVAVGFPETKAFANGQNHRVNRILILPFRKSAENLTNDNVNFIPVYTYAMQMDVSQFPVNNATLHLPVDVTYKVLMIGYSQSDYDFNNRISPANRFDIGSVTTPVTLANFHLFPKSPTYVPEFFTCLAEAFSGSTSQGNTFKPEQNFTLQGTIKRLVSGLSITITNIPVFVKSITLSAENLVKSSLALDATVTQWQTTGDGGNRVMDKKTPVNGTITFSNFLLPTFATYKTGFTLGVELGITTQNYTVKAPNGTVVSNNQFIFNPNEAINLTGDYTTAINFGFSISNSINLDDDQWDGYITNPLIP